MLLLFERSKYKPESAKIEQKMSKMWPKCDFFTIFPYKRILPGACAPEKVLIMI